MPLFLTSFLTCYSFQIEVHSFEDFHLAACSQLIVVGIQLLHKHANPVQAPLVEFIHHLTCMKTMKSEWKQIGK